MNLNFEEVARKNKRKKILKECFFWLVEIIVVIVLAYLLIHYCIRKTMTIGSAMEPTLYNGEEVFINTKSYLVFSPKREDVVAFYDKGAEADGSEEPLIIFRRIIGLPGETVQITDGQIFIDGQQLKESYQYARMMTSGIAEQEIKLGEEEYFVLCDSRIDSEDSRNASFGNIKKEQIIGKVTFTMKPFSMVSGPNRGMASESPGPTEGTD